MTGRKIGYARVSTDKQKHSVTAQVSALRAAGCAEIFTDEAISGSSTRRNGLDRALACVQSGDTLVVWKLDRLARSLTYLCDLLDGFTQKNIGFVSLTDGIDTTTHSGKLVCQILGAIAEFERSIAIERTLLGLETARKSGKKLGRPPKLSNCRLRCAHRLIYEKGWSVKNTARLCRVSVSTLRRGLERIDLVTFT